MDQQKEQQEENENQLPTLRKQFWQQQEPTVEAMIQAVSADDLASQDADEVMAMLPDLSGKRVLDLGAGIGRFTGRLARVVGHVMAVDLSQTLIEENRAKNQHYPNVAFICDDVLNLNLPPGSVDLVFSNWLLKYLSEAEVATLLGHALSWIAPRGHIFFRESCYMSLGSVNRASNPTIYRRPQHYAQLLRQAQGADLSTFRLLRSKSILAYINRVSGQQQEQQMQGQAIDAPEHPLATKEATKAAAVRVGASTGLKEGQKVLEVGCGQGDMAFFLARHYQVHVHGVDDSPDSVYTAIQRQVEADHIVRRKLHFEMSAGLELHCEDDSYDLILSRQTLHTSQDKQKTLAYFYRCVKPGGRVVITDYCTGASHPPCPAPTYQQAPALATVDGLATMLREAGFKAVASEDLSQELIKTLENGLNNPQASISGSTHDLVQEQVRLAKEGQLVWASFTAVK